jgi:hypothetical protein
LGISLGDGGPDLDRTFGFALSYDFDRVAGYR